MLDLVIGIDASTTAVKAIAFTRDGALAAEARAAYPLSMPAPGHVEQAPGDWQTALASALRELGGAIDPARVAGIAITHQRETFALLDAKAKAIRPAILWLDERGRRQVIRLSAALGHNTVRDWTGQAARPDASALRPRLAEAA